MAPLDTGTLTCTCSQQCTISTKLESFEDWLISSSSFHHVVILNQGTCSDLDLITNNLISDDTTAVVGLEYSYFAPSLDVFDFAEKIQSSATPEKSDSIQLDLLIPVERFGLTLGYEYKPSSASVTRAVQPLSLETKINTHTLEITRKVSEFKGMELSILGGVSYAKQDPLKIDCYAQGSLVLGGFCPEADFSLVDGLALLNEGVTLYKPVLTTEADAMSYRIGGRLTGMLFQTMPFYAVAKLQQARISTSYQSDLLNITDESILNSEFQGITLSASLDSITADLPQTEPWKENSLTLSFGASRQLSTSLSASLELKQLFVSRSGYTATAGTKAYNQNTIFNAALWYTPRPSIAVYLRGEASSHNVLGLDPLAYNRKTSRFFEHSFGQLSIGVVTSF